MSKVKHILFLCSPILIAGVTVFSMLHGSMTLSDTLLLLFKGYVAFYFMISGYVVFRYRKVDLQSKWDQFFIRSGYPIAATIFFAWLFILPLLEKTVGMWESEALNMIVTLATANIIFFILIKLYDWVLPSSLKRKSASS